MRTLTATLLLALGTLSCGGDEDPASGPAKDPSTTSTSPTGTFVAEDQTPGLYRDTYRLLDAVKSLSDDVAIDRLIQDVTHKLTATNTMSGMDSHTKDTLTGLYVLALRSMQATESHPDVARGIGEHILQTVLALDPARLSWNQNNPDNTVVVASAGAAVISDNASFAITQAANAPIDSTGHAMVSGFNSSMSAECATTPTTRAATWDSGNGNSVWFPRYCYDAHWIPGYCESGTWVDGNCYDSWVSTGSCGSYQDQGYYDYQCYDSYNCDYQWVDDYVWVDQGCGSGSSNGYYAQQCDGGHYEDGLCYSDVYVPGYCIPGHYVSEYPQGGWAFYSAPVDCQPVVVPQAAVAQTAAKILSGSLSSDIGDDSWRAAVVALVATPNVPDAGYVDAMRQVLVAAKTPPVTEQN